MDATRWKQATGVMALPTVLAATVALVAYFPRPEQVEAVRDRVFAWWGDHGSPGAVDGSARPRFRTHVPAPARDRDRE